jgi:nucleolar complex protein 3
MGQNKGNPNKGGKRHRRQQQSASKGGKSKKEQQDAGDDENFHPFASLSVEEKCDLIASISEAVMADPTKAFHQEREEVSRKTVTPTGSEDLALAEPKTIRLPSKIQNLLDLGRVHKNGGDEYVASLAIMSLLALFKDMIPAYRIRLPTDAERAGKVSKEIKQLWDYERALITHYQQYLQLLEKVWEQNQMDNKVPNRLGITAMLSMCELLKAAFHFNFRSNILSAVILQMNNRHCDQVSEACCQAVEHVFQNDVQGEVAMEAARQVAKLIKEYRGILRQEVLRSFTKLPLRVHIDEAEAAKLAAQANKKKRKKDKDLAEIEAEMKEGSASVDKIVLARAQSETLQAVVLTYFRILKSADAQSKKNLLPAALEGLAKFAHLINIDTVIDLLECLKHLLVGVDDLPLEAALNCILTAFQTLQGPGKEMQIDVKEYISPLYTQLTRLATENSCEGNTKIMLRCLDFALIRRRELSKVRIAAFFKRILSVAMHTPAYTSVPLIAFARQLTQRYPSIHQLLDNESDVITSGQYTPDVPDPEHTNPFSTSAWEISTLKFSLDPAVSHQAIAAGGLKLLAMPGEAPDRLYADMSRDKEEVYIKFRRHDKKHPLLGKASDKRKQARFVTPRKRDITLLSIPENDEGQYKMITSKN